MCTTGPPSLHVEIKWLFLDADRDRHHREKAAPVIGLSTSIGTRCFHHRGGMPLLLSKHVSERYLSLAELEDIELLRAQSFGLREIANHSGRSPSTLSRELTRSVVGRYGRFEY